jgi:hypothetical protein
MGVKPSANFTPPFGDQRRGQGSQICPGGSSKEQSTPAFVADQRGILNQVNAGIGSGNPWRSGNRNRVAAAYMAVDRQLMRKTLLAFPCLFYNSDLPFTGLIGLAIAVLAISAARAAVVRAHRAAFIDPIRALRTD